MVASTQARAATSGRSGHRPRPRQPVEPGHHGAGLRRGSYNPQSHGDSVEVIDVASWPKGTEVTVAIQLSGRPTAGEGDLQGRGRQLHQDLQLQPDTDLCLAR